MKRPEFLDAVLARKYDVSKHEGLELAEYIQYLTSNERRNGILAAPIKELFKASLTEELGVVKATFKPKDGAASPIVKLFYFPGERAAAKQLICNVADVFKAEEPANET